MSYPKKPRKISSLYGGFPRAAWVRERQSLFPKNKRTRDIGN